MKEYELKEVIRDVTDKEIEAINTLTQQALDHMLMCYGFNAESANTLEKSQELKIQMKRRGIELKIVESDFISEQTSPTRYINLEENRKVVMSAEIIRSINAEGKAHLILEYTKEY